MTVPIDYHSYRRLPHVPSRPARSLRRRTLLQTFGGLRYPDLGPDVPDFCCPKTLMAQPATPQHESGPASRSGLSWERGHLARNGPKARGCPCGQDARAPRKTAQTYFTAKQTQHYGYGVASPHENFLRRRLLGVVCRQSPPGRHVLPGAWASRPQRTEGPGCPCGQDARVPWKSHPATEDPLPCKCPVRGRLACMVGPPAKLGSVDMPPE